MKALLFILAALVVVLTITTIEFYHKNKALTVIINEADAYMDSSDDYWAEIMGDYQLDIHMDTMWLRDNERKVTKFIIPKNPTDSITLAIFKDNL